jgi:hypothetical protein
MACQAVADRQAVTPKGWRQIHALDLISSGDRDVGNHEPPNLANQNIEGIRPGVGQRRDDGRRWCSHQNGNLGLASTTGSRACCWRRNDLFVSFACTIMVKSVPETHRKRSLPAPIYRQAGRSAFPSPFILSATITSELAALLHQQPQGNSDRQSHNGARSIAQ